MKTIKIAAIMLSILTSLHSFASREGGNGGDIVDDQLLDLVEDHSDLLNDIIPRNELEEYFPNEDHNIKAELDDLKLRIKNIWFFDFYDEAGGDYEVHQLLIFMLENMEWYFVNELTELNDEGSIHIEDPSSRKQLAVQDIQTGKVFIHKDRYNSLSSPKQKVALIFHELMVAYIAPNAKLEHGTELIRLITNLTFNSEDPVNEVHAVLRILKLPQSRSARAFKRGRINKEFELFKKNQGRCAFDSRVAENLEDDYNLSWNLEMALNLGTHVGRDATFKTLENLRNEIEAPIFNRFVTSSESYLKSDGCTEINILGELELKKHCVYEVLSTYTRLVNTYKSVGRTFPGCGY